MNSNDVEESVVVCSAESLEDDSYIILPMDPESYDIVMEVVHPGTEIPWTENIDIKTASPRSAVLLHPDICRVCAEKSVDLVSIYDEQGINLNLAKKIHWHLPIEVSRSDQLPLSMCHSCVTRLNACHEFANMSFEADCKLTSIHEVKDTVELQWYDANKPSTKREKCKKRSLPANELCAGIEELRREKQRKIENSLLEENNEDFQEVYLEQSIDDLKGQVLDVSIESVGEEPLPAGLWKTANLRVKMPKDFADCDTSLKSQIVGAIQDIMIEEDQCASPKKKGSNEFFNEWKCDVCGHIAPRKSSLLVHQRRIHSRPFACSYCYKTFTNKVARFSHESSHIESSVEVKQETLDTDYKCETCDKVFKHSKALIQHNRREHNVLKPYQCDKCDKKYRSMTSLNVHKSNHSSETPFLCDLCGKKFKHVANLRNHKYIHRVPEAKRRNVCEICGNGFRSPFHLSEHRNIHLNRKPYSCDVCGKQFHKKIQVRQHGSAHSGAAFKCQLCGVRFNRRGNLTQHLKRHQQPVKFTCRVCSYAFDSLSNLLQHRKNHTREEIFEANLRLNPPQSEGHQNGYSCEICKKVLAKKDSLVIHMRTHTGEKLFSCKVCGKKLSNKGSLTYHMRSYHTGERPYPCQYCNSSFLTKEACLVHERLHTGVKPFVCSICTMAFRCSSNLAQHVRVHSDLRPFVCPHCEKRFLRKGALTVHLRIHTGDRPFICDLCGRGFTQKNDMFKHHRTHTMERPFVCDQCGATFSHKRGLTKHQLIHIETIEQIVEMGEPQTVIVTTTEDNMLQNYSAENVDNCYQLTLLSPQLKVNE